MNPVGINLLTISPETAESTAASSKTPAAAGGDFVTQFLALIFAEPESTLQSPEQLQLRFRDGESNGEIRTETGEDQGDFETLEIPVESLSGEPELKPALDLISQQIDQAAAPEEEGKKGLDLRPELLLSREPRRHRLAPTVGVPVDGSVKTTPQATGETGKLPDSVPVKTWPFPPQLSSQGVSVIRADEVSREGDFRSDVSTAAREQSVQESKSIQNPVSPPEATKIKAAESFRLPTEKSGRPPFAERGVEALALDRSRVKLEADRGPAAPDRSPKESLPITGHDKQESPAGREPHPGRSSVSGNTDPLEPARHLEPASLFRVQVESEKPRQVLTKGTGSEVENGVEVLLSGRPGSNLVSGHERLILQEPLLARELIQGQNTHSFDRIVDQIVKQVSLQQKGEIFQLGVRLKPEFLGEIRIETIMEADKTMRAVIRAEDHSVRALLEGKVGALVQRFEDAGIHVQKVEVQTLAPDGGSGHDSSTGRQGSGQPKNTSASTSSHAELSKESGEDAKDMDDGHIHLFI